MGHGAQLQLNHALLALLSGRGGQGRSVLIGQEKAVPLPPRTSVRHRIQLAVLREVCQRPALLFDKRADRNLRSKHYSVHVTSHTEEAAVKSCVSARETHCDVGGAGIASKAVLTASRLSIFPMIHR